MSEVKKNLHHQKESALFKIELSSNFEILALYTGFLEIHLPDDFRKILLIPGEILSLPNPDEMDYPYVTAFAITDVQFELGLTENIFSSEKYQIKNINSMHFYPTSKVHFSPEFLNTLLALIKIFDWHVKDSPKQPLSFNIIKFECQKFQVTSDPMLKILLQILHQYNYIKSITELSYTIQKLDSLLDISSYIKSMLNNQIYDPWYLYHVQLLLLKMLLLLQINSVANDFTLSEGNLQEIFLISNIPWGTAKNVLQEWHHKKIIKIEEKSSKEREYHFQFSHLQNLWSVFATKNETVYELLRFYNSFQQNIITYHQD